MSNACRHCIPRKQSTNGSQALAVENIKHLEIYFVNGLTVEMAEGLAEYTNRLVCSELGLDADRGRRYSWGYPAIPDLEDHAKLFQLLPGRIL